MPHRRLCLIVLAIVLTSSVAPAAATSKKPNIIFILADDLGYGDVGCYKKLPGKIPTPNIDRIAAEGMRFTDAHSPSSVCSPTRYALLTGRYSWRSPLQNGVVLPWGGTIFRPGRTTVAELLKQHGYATAMIGKWHLGIDWPTKDGKPATSGESRLSNVDFTKAFGDGPTAHGFDWYFGVDIPNYPPYCFLENDHSVGIPSLPDEGREKLFNRPGPMLPGWRLVDILPELTRRAAGYVEQAAKKPQPFFLYFALTSPHYPVVPADEFKGKTKVGDFGDFVHQTDWSVGQVLAALDKAGMADNTLVFFTSDNGPEITGEVKPGAYDRIKEYQHHSMDGLRGAKRDLWEGGHRVAFVARWPGQIKPGSVSGETICHVDFTRTVADILGEKLPDTTAEDSYSLLPVLRGETLQSPLREATVHHAASGRFAIRKGDWVLITQGTGDDNGRNGEPDWFKQERGYVADDAPGQLFNLKEDLIEKQNHYRDKPEIVAELSALLKQYQDNGRSTPGKPQENDVPIGGPAAKGKRGVGK